MNFVKFYLIVIYFITFNGGGVKNVYADVNNRTSGISIQNSTTNQQLNDFSETFLKQALILKKEVDKELSNYYVEYETVLNKYLGRNKTLNKVIDVGSSTKTIRDSKTFMDKVKEKFQKFLDFFRRIGSKNQETETRIKRCLMEDSFENFDYGEVSIDENIMNTLKSMTNEELENYLKKLIKCFNGGAQRLEAAFSVLGNETEENKGTRPDSKMSDDKALDNNTNTTQTPHHETTKNLPAADTNLKLKSDEQAPSFTNCTTQNFPSDDNKPNEDADGKYHQLSKFLANVQHPVELTGKPPQKPINLQNVNDFLKNLKSLNQDIADNSQEYDSFKETTEASDDPMLSDIYSSLPLSYEVKRNTRNVFEDFSKSIRGLLVNEKPKQASNIREQFENKNYKEKRKSSQLMENLEMASVEKEPEEEPVEENVHEEMLVDESQGLQNDLDGFKSRINPGQQVEILNFLKQLNQGPKPFSFDTESFLKLQTDKLEHSTDQQQSNDEINPSNSIAKKYFEFEDEEKKEGKEPAKVVKRNNEPIDNNWEDLKNIAKIKSRLVNDYKNYHSDISQFLHDFKKPEAPKHELNMVDNFFLLNDGKTKLEDFMNKPIRVDSKMNLFDLNLDLQLDKEFQDLEYERQFNQKSMFPNLANDDVSKIPLKKTFEFINTEDNLP